VAKSIGGSREFGSTADPPTGQNQNPPTEYEAVKGDCLSKIAEHFYGTQRWPVIFCANRKKIVDPDLFSLGVHIRMRMQRIFDVNREGL
jgi:nucleoid-associated protein YgaU